MKRNLKMQRQEIRGRRWNEFDEELSLYSMECIIAVKFMYITSDFLITATRCSDEKTQFPLTYVTAVEAVTDAMPDFYISKRFFYSNQCSAGTRGDLKIIYISPHSTGLLVRDSVRLRKWTLNINFTEVELCAQPIVWLPISLPIQLGSLWNFKLKLLGYQIAILTCIINLDYPKWLPNVLM